MRRTTLVIAIFAAGLFALSGSVARAGDYPSPPVPNGQVIAGVLSGGGPNLSGELLASIPRKPGDSPHGYDFDFVVDADGKPVKKKSGQHTHRVHIHLSHERDGSGGYCWYASIEVIDLATGRITNVGDNAPESAGLGGTGKGGGNPLNDPEVAKRFDKQLHRTPNAALAEAMKRLNQGLKGRIRLAMLRNADGTRKKK